MYKASLPSLRFQAHLAFSQGLPLDQKCQKSLQAHPTPTQGLKVRVAKIKDSFTNDKNGQLPTRGIKHWGLGGYTNNISRNTVCCTLIVKCLRNPQRFHTANR